MSSFCLGTTVMSSISHRKETSEGTSPGGRGNAMMARYNLGFLWDPGTRRRNCWSWKLNCFRHYEYLNTRVQNPSIPAETPPSPELQRCIAGEARCN